MFCTFGGYLKYVPHPSSPPRHGVCGGFIYATAQELVERLPYTMCLVLVYNSAFHGVSLQQCLSIWVQRHADENIGILYVDIIICTEFFLQ
jgi:hypothetical protein